MTRPISETAAEACDVDDLCYERFGRDSGCGRLESSGGGGEVRRNSPAHHIDVSRSVPSDAEGDFILGPSR